MGGGQQDDEQQDMQAAHDGDGQMDGAQMDGMDPADVD